MKHQGRNEERRRMEGGGIQKCTKRETNREESRGGGGKEEGKYELRKEYQSKTLRDGEERRQGG